MPTWRRRHLSRRCPTYAPIWAGDQRVKMFAALNAYGEGQVRMISVTAPGVESLPWDLDHCAHLGPHRHSGEIGCRVLPAAAAAFNKHAPAWWSELHRQARQGAKRTGEVAPVLLARIYELQKRGVLHLHLLLGYSTFAEKRAADLYLEELVRLAPRHGFGFVDRKLEVKEPAAAAAYLSSYFVTGRKRKMALSESVKSTAMPVSIIYIAPWLSTRSGITMRSLRLRRFAWQLWRRYIEPAGLDEVTVFDIWAGLVAGRTLAQTVSSCL